MPGPYPGQVVRVHSENSIDTASARVNREVVKQMLAGGMKALTGDAALKSKLESDLITVYVGYRGEQVIGYAIFDTHVVRTMPETFLVVLSPAGAVSATYLLAFYEPSEYAPPERWLAQFHDATLSDELRVGRGIVGITNSTLTSAAVTGGIRRALAIHAVLLKGH